MPHITLITNYGAVLAFVALMGRVTARQIAMELGVTERTVLRIIAQLERGGYLRRERVGRINQYHVNAHLGFGSLGEHSKGLRSFVQWMLSGAQPSPSAEVTSEEHQPTLGSGASS